MQREGSGKSVDRAMELWCGVEAPRDPCQPSHGTGPTGEHRPSTGLVRPDLGGWRGHQRNPIPLLGPIQAIPAIPPDDRLPWRDHLADSFAFSPFAPKRSCSLRIRGRQHTAFGYPIDKDHPCSAATCLVPAHHETSNHLRDRSPFFRRGEVIASWSVGSPPN